MQFSSVDLPTPDSPSSATSSPRAIVSATSEKTKVSAKRLARPATRSSGAPAGAGVAVIGREHTGPRAYRPVGRRGCRRSTALPAGSFTEVKGCKNPHFHPCNEAAPLLTFAALPHNLR